MNRSLTTDAIMNYFVPTSTAISLHLKHNYTTLNNDSYSSSHYL
jgi:hypothetical protein